MNKLDLSIKRLGVMYLLVSNVHDKTEFLKPTEIKKNRLSSKRYYLVYKRGVECYKK